MDRHLLPRTSEDAGHLYVEHARIEREDGAIVIVDVAGKTPVPAATLSVLLLGPGTTITHAAVLLAAEVDCLISWVGEGEERFYATGSPDRTSGNLLRQARLWADPKGHLLVVHRMYEYRFGEKIEPDTRLEVLRGREGLRVRATYAKYAEKSGVVWDGRTTKTKTWLDASPINRSISAANVALYGVVHSAIIAAGFSPALGFIHTGSTRSFVFDIADLYKTEITIPTAFATTAADSENIERRTRAACRVAFRSAKLLDRLVGDIKTLLVIPPSAEDDPPRLWSPDEL